MHFPRLFTGLALGALIIAGCSDATGPSTFAPPKVGSTFTYTVADVDSNGVEISGSARVLRFSIVDDDTTIAGKSGAMLFAANTAPARPVAMKYEANGDISLQSFYSNAHSESGVDIYSFATPVTWVALPFGSKKKEDVTVLSYDTSATIQGKQASYTVRQTVIYNGDEEITIGTKKVNASKVTLKTSWEVRYDTTGEKVDYVEGLWYSPEVGYMVKMNGTRRSNQTPPFSGWQYMLTEYSRK